MSTAVQALTRAPFRPLEVLEGWDAQLLQEAAKLLGYRPKALQEAEAARKRSLDEDTLAKALEAVDIQPFTLSSVKAYKARMLREAHKGESWKCTRYMHKSGEHTMRKGQTVVNAVGWPSWIGFGVTAAVCALGRWDGYATWGWDAAAKKSIQIAQYMSWPTVEHVMALPTAAVGIWGLLMYLRHKRANIVTAKWNAHSVSDTSDRHFDGYKEAIPAFAVQRMLSLKRELPEVTFSVEQLDATREDLNTEHRKPLPPDPFLVATFRGISCYIDVWDEPKFEGRRAV